MTLQYDGAGVPPGPAAALRRTGGPRARRTRADHGRTIGIPTIARWQRTALVLLASLAVSACATGSIRDGMYRDPGGRFTVGLPPAGWRPIPLDGATLAFRAPALGAGMSLRVDCDDPESGPLSAVARHLFFGLVDKQTESREAVTVADARGIRTRLRARLEGRPVTVEGVTVRRGPCLYDFAYVAPPQHFDAGRPDFEAFLTSWTPLAAP